jgi:CheY-like chemotaxis protein
MTAGRAADDIERCREAGMDGHMPKPVDLDDLRRELTAVVSSFESE